MIDWNLFRSTLAPYPQEMILEVIDTFITSYPTDRALLQAAILARDFQVIERKAHDVKTNCLWVGGSAAADLALQIEMKGKNLEEAQLDTLFPLMDKAVEQVLGELAEYRKSR